jgi:hypothetical protein
MSKKFSKDKAEVLDTLKKVSNEGLVILGELKIERQNFRNGKTNIPFARTISTMCNSSCGFMRETLKANKLISDLIK